MRGARCHLPSCNSSCILGDPQLWVPSSTGADDDDDNDDIVSSSSSSGRCWGHHPCPHHSCCCPLVPVMRGAHHCLPSCNSSCILGDLQLWAPSSTGADDDDDIVFSSSSLGQCWGCHCQGGAGVIVVVLIIPVAGPLLMLLLPPRPHPCHPCCSYCHSRCVGMVGGGTGCHYAAVGTPGSREVCGEGRQRS
jgi:hypothetical protein